MWPDQVSNPGPLALEPDALLTALHSPTLKHLGQNIIHQLTETTVPVDECKTSCTVCAACPVHTKNSTF